jgi:hypothetical protein
MFFAHENMFFAGGGLSDHGVCAKQSYDNHVYGATYKDTYGT